MVPLFGAILCSQDSETQLDLILARLNYEGLKAKHVNPKNWKDVTDGIRVFTKSNFELARELLDWSIEPLLYGNFSPTDKEAYQSIGVTLCWDRDISDLFHLPLFMLKPGSCFWSICTSNPRLDKHLSLILKSFGQIVFTEGDPDHLISRLRTNPIQLVILDWDQKQLEIQSKIPLLKKLKQEKEMLFIGIKNFDKENLYRDLSLGISEISPSLFNQREILEVIVRSLPVIPQKVQNSSIPSSFRKLEFDFQEKIKPTRYRVIEVNMEDNSKGKDETEIDSLVSVFQWLFHRSFE